MLPEGSSAFQRSAIAESIPADAEKRENGCLFAGLYAYDIIIGCRALVTVRWRVKKRGAWFYVWHMRYF